MNNQRGFGSIMMASIVLLMVVTFMGSASFYFSALYRDIMIQQRAVAADVIMEDFGKMIQQAHHTYASNGNTCPDNGTTQEQDPTRPLCWPRGSATNPNANCVKTPFGAGESGTRFICRSPVGSQIKETINSMNVVQFETRIYDDRSFGEKLESTLVAARDSFSMGLDIIAGQVQSFAFAQTSSESAFLPSLASVPTSTFASAITCPAAGPASAYCKYCEAGVGDFQTCVRLRICLNPNGCNPANGNQWVQRTIGILSR